MKELITLDQANRLMLALIVIAPVVGTLIGLALKRVRACGLAGLAIGIGNYALWRVYNAITDQLGLDSVKNLVVNLVLFAVVGVAFGLIFAWVQGRRPETVD